MRVMPSGKIICVTCLCTWEHNKGRKGLLCPECGRRGKYAEAEHLREMIIISDTREQYPYIFPNYVAVKRDTLNTGDYSVVGMESIITVERKSKTDLFGSLGKGRARFKREFQRLSEIPKAYLMVESSLENLSKRPSYSRMNPVSVIRSLISWSEKYNVHIIYAGDRESAELYTLRLLESAWKHYDPKNEGDSVDIESQLR